MKKAFLFLLLPICLITVVIALSRSNANIIDTEIISFYEVPLVCGAAPDIGCGSRVKPLFIDTEKISEIKESWLNRPGTVIGIIWDGSMSNEADREKIIQPLFEKHTIDASLITDVSQIKELSAGLKGKEKWYKGMDVDQLSIEESGRIAESVVKDAKDANLLNEEESRKIKGDIEAYFKNELVQVRTYDNLKSEETQGRWFKDIYDIVVKHVGKERANKIKNFYYGNGEAEEEPCCKEDKKDKSCCSKE